MERLEPGKYKPLGTAEERDERMRIVKSYLRQTAEESYDISRRERDAARRIIFRIRELGLEDKV